MSREHDVVRNVLRELSVKVRDSKEALSAQAVGNALYGHLRKSRGHEERGAVMKGVSGKVRSSREVLSAQAVGQSCYSMQCYAKSSGTVRIL